KSLSRVASGISFLVGIGLLAFLIFWYFELVLWAIFGPFMFGSLYLARRLWTPSAALPRVVIIWAVSLAWTLSAVLLLFKSVTVFGAVVATLIAIAAVWLLYVWAQRLVRAHDKSAQPIAS